MFINKNFTSMWFFNFFSILNDRFRELVIPLITLAFTSSPLITALVALSQQLGAILFAIPLGTWLETKNKVRVSTVCNLIYAFCLFILSFLITLDHFNSTIMAIVLFVMGILALLSRTAFSAMVPLIAGREKLLKAHTSLEAADALCTIIGPALGGYLLGKLGSSPTLMICGVLSITAMALISLVKNKHISASISHDVPPTPTIKLMNFIKNSNKGLKLLIANSPQLISLVVLCVLSFSTVFIPLTIIFHTDITLNLSAGEIGIILSSAGIGNLIGVLIMRWFKSINWLTFLSSLLIISSLGVFILFLNDSFYLMCLGMIIFDGALSMAFVSQITVHQGITPDQYLSRIRSVTFVVSGIFAMLGTFLAGFIPEIISSFFSLFLGFILLVIPGVFILKFKAISCKMNELQPIHVEEKE